ncbi:thermonuclease family protein [Nitrospina gracilis]|uniref:thermonuclease family protein n=1 Tax=Nitrospina gracilis TaxID=35801 RepID=UPI001F266EFE|nr:thermonuclease family protein [Nitrospina gracilis]MCF8721906.1 endonuclease YncB(thermonuclease family) [Nitrospina gracilis Nb-211]
MHYLKLVAGVALLTAALGSPEKVLVGHAVEILSGDTFALEAENKLYKVRLEEVDAPERGQPFGKQSRDYLEELILHRAIRVDVSFVDKYGQQVGRAVLAGGRVVNDEVVAQGYGWHYRATPNPDARLARLEQYAFAHSLGLWMQVEPVPPWEHRREKIIPEAPWERAEMDYDRVLHYGIVGDVKSRIYQWPACRGYTRAAGINKPVIFQTRKQAEEMGYRPAARCPS